MAGEAWIVESDGQASEPLDLAQLKAMDLTGKQVRPVGSWSYLSETELSALLADGSVPTPDAPVSIPPVNPVPPPAVAQYPRPIANPVAPPDDPMRFLVPVNPSGWAMAAGYLGLFSVLCVFAPFAIVAGIMGFRDIKKNPNKTGIGRVRFGLIMGSVFTVFMIVALIMSQLK